MEAVSRPHRPTGWYACDCVDDEEPPVDPYGWHPVLQNDSENLHIEIWFRTKEECVAYIKTQIAGYGMYPD